MKTMNRIRKTMLIVFAAMTMLLVTAGPAQAAGLTAKQKIFKTYSSFLAKNSFVKDIPAGSHKTGAFSCAYINGDNIPDLIVAYKTNGYQPFRCALIYTYKNGRVTLLANCPGDVSGYYRKQNFIYSSGQWLFGRLEQKYYTPNLYCTTTNGTLFINRIQGKSVTYSQLRNSRKVECTAKTFASLLKKRTNGVRYTRFNFKSNTAANRKAVFGF